VLSCGDQVFIKFSTEPWW